MNVFLVIFTLCGQPVYVTGQSQQGPIVGSLAGAPREAVEQIGVISLTPGALILERRLEALTGTRCT